MIKGVAIRRKLMAAAGIALAMMSCEEQITPTLENAAPVLVVDAWLNNRPEAQVIQLTQTQPYFENAVPPGLSGAVVTVTDNHQVAFSFAEDDKNPGKYVWKPAPGAVFGKVGDSYRLTIQANGETYEATSTMGRVPLIDSVTFDKDKRTGTGEVIVRGEFWATDPAGRGDTYWIRTYKNGVRLNKPGEILVAYDAGFSAGSLTDGVTFIAPIRRGVNARDKDASGKALSPIAGGDSIYVELHSITEAAFNYLKQVQVQTDRPGGFQELFSKPLSNVSTNVSNVNPAGMKVLGFFNVSSVSASGKRYNP